jgi:hypothetical protein
MNRNLYFLVILAFWICAAYSEDSFAAQKAAKQKTKTIPKSAAEVITLGNIDQIKDAFQRDKGNVRLVTIISPT